MQINNSNNQPSFGAIKLNVKASVNEIKEATPEVKKCLGEIFEAATKKLGKSTHNGTLDITDVKHYGKQALPDFETGKIVLEESVFGLTGSIAKQGKKAKQWKVELPVPLEQHQTNKTVEEYSSGLTSFVEMPFKPLHQRVIRGIWNSELIQYPIRVAGGIYGGLKSLSR